MSAFDVAICMDQSTLQRIIAALYAQPGFRQDLFSGGGSVTVAGVPLSVAYDVLAAPTVTLEAPTAAQWQSAIQADGTQAQPTGNAMVLHLPQVRVTRSPGSPQAASTVVAFDAIAVVSLSAGQLRISPVGVCIDLSSASTTDQTLFRGLIIPRILTQIGALLAAESVPNISLQGARFGDAVLVLGSGRLAAVANLQGRPAPAAPSPQSLPPVPFCVLLSQTAMQAVAATATAGLRGKQLEQSGSASFGIGTAQYTARLSVDSLSVSVQSPTTVQANAGLSASASASVDVVGAIWDQITGAASTVASGLETAGNAIKDAFSSY